ncbi:hypothetical protein BVI434_160021 [Burkholderia vietnamiensis]|nr:hypothetical protein BVI434_160021 [Burkholderia vietnamiensis]
MLRRSTKVSAGSVTRFSIPTAFRFNKVARVRNVASIACPFHVKNLNARLAWNPEKGSPHVLRLDNER